MAPSVETLLDLNNVVLPLLATVLAYMLGSLSFAVIVSRVMGLNDPRSYGSKNPGATNVLRSGSKVAAVLTLALDGVKGWLPVALVVFYGQAYGLGGGTVALVGLAAFLGHLYPLFFRFKGGKGVATAAGVLLGINGWLGLAVLLTWLTVALVFRYSSLAALLAALSAPLYYFLGERWSGSADRGIELTVLVMSALLIGRHRENITRLLKGQESKLGAKKK